MSVQGVRFGQPVRTHRARNSAILSCIALYEKHLRRVLVTGPALAPRVLRNNDGHSLARDALAGDGTLSGGPSGPLSGGDATTMSDFSPSPATARRVRSEGTRSSERLRRERLRRAVNVAVALIGLIVAAPLMLLVAIAIKLDSRGPVVFRQERVGLDRRGDRGRRASDRRRVADVGGRLFTMYNTAARQRREGRHEHRGPSA